MRSEGFLEWRKTQEFVPYDVACDFMGKRVEAIISGEKSELIWLLEHPPLYTIGTSGSEQDVLQNPHKIPCVHTGRGGQVTYHGPGQRIGYVMLNLKKRGLSPRGLTSRLEEWIRTVLSELGVKSFSDPNRIGVWINGAQVAPQSFQDERKIAAIGVRIRRGVSFHGFALNVCPDLKAFDSIIPCGLSQFRATSLQEIEASIPLEKIDLLLQETFEQFF